jgi:undecaprenyl-diphosphatase
VILASASEPITYLQAIILGLLQGVTELFPISSLGHSVIFPQLFGWNIHQNDDYFISFLVATHLATAIVLFLFFWRDWMRIFKGLGRSLRDRGIGADDTDAKLGVRVGAVGVDLPDGQRADALRVRGAAAPRAAD